MEVHAQVTSKGQALLRAPQPPSGRSRTPTSAWSTRPCRECSTRSTGSSVEEVVGTGLGPRPNQLLRASTARTTSTRTCRRAIRSASSTTRSSARARSRRPRAGPRPRVRVDRIHLEQDAGKSIHDLDPDLSFVDLNRTGVRPDGDRLEARPPRPEEAAEYVRKLRQILRYLGTCDGNMQEGKLRADVNCRCGGARPARDRCEIKNMNSMRFINAGDRVRGEAPDRAPRGWGRRSSRRPASTTRTGARRARCAPRRRRTTTAISPTPTSCRSSSRTAWIEAIAAHLPEFADAIKARFVRRVRACRIRRRRVDRRDRATPPTSRPWPAAGDGKQAANWVINELFGRLKKEGQGRRAEPARAGAARRRRRPRGSGEFGQDRQGRLRDPWSEGGDPGDNRGRAGPPPSDGRRRDRGSGRRGGGGEPGKGRAGEGASPRSPAGWFVGQAMKTTAARPTRRR